MKKLLSVLVAFLLFIFLYINIISSQSISPLYFNLVNGDKTAAVEFLKKLQTHPDFVDQFNFYKGFFGSDVQAALSADSRERNMQIQKLEVLLKQNPRARDVLYALSVLYNEEGNKAKAEEYMKKTQEVDPNIR